MHYCPRFASLFLLLVLLFAAGCGDTPPSTKPASPAGNTPASADAPKLRAGLVTDTGGVGDKSFNALAWEGLQKAGKDFGFEVKYTESKQNGDYVANLSRYADDGYDVVFAVGFLMNEAVQQVAAKYPKVKFAIIDGEPANLPNLVAYRFREEEGSFLAGALAGLTTKKNKVGFVGGNKGALIEKFEFGYTAGVKTTNPKATVVTGYAGAFNDPQKGQELAISQMDAGADIIYQAAGATGTGVIKAVANKGKGYFAIGVDKDQDGDAPGRVLTSVLKGVDTAIYDVCKSVKENKYQPGTVELGLKENGVGLSKMTYTKDAIPAGALAKIDGLKKQIVAGTLKPPATADALAAFKAP